MIRFLAVIAVTTFASGARAGDGSHTVEVVTADGVQVLETGPAPVADLAVEDGVVSWKRDGAERRRAIFRG